MNPEVISAALVVLAFVLAIIVFVLCFDFIRDIPFWIDYWVMNGGA